MKGIYHHDVDETSRTSNPFELLSSLQRPTNPGCVEEKYLRQLSANDNNTDYQLAIPTTGSHSAISTRSSTALINPGTLGTLLAQRPSYSLKSPPLARSAFLWARSKIVRFPSSLHSIYTNLTIHTQPREPVVNWAVSPALLRVYSRSLCSVCLSELSNVSALTDHLESSDIDDTESLDCDLHVVSSPAAVAVDCNSPLMLEKPLQLVDNVG